MNQTCGHTPLYAQDPVRWVDRITPCLYCKIDQLTQALQFVQNLSKECLDNGDVRVGTAAEVAMRHIHRRSRDTLNPPQASAPQIR